MVYLSFVKIFVWLFLLIAKKWTKNSLGQRKGWSTAHCRTSMQSSAWAVSECISQKMVFYAVNQAQEIIKQVQVKFFQVWSLYEIRRQSSKILKNEQHGFLCHLLVPSRNPLEKSSPLLWFYTVMKKLLCLQNINLPLDMKRQIFAHHLPNSSLGAVCSLASAQQSVSQGEMDKQKGISLKLTARGQEWLEMLFYLNLLHKCRCPSLTLKTMVLRSHSLWADWEMEQQEKKVQAKKEV